jgi:hypothetical protein
VTGKWQMTGLGSGASRTSYIYYFYDDGSFMYFETGDSTPSKIDGK